MMTTMNRDTDSAVELHRVLTVCLTRKYKLSEQAASAMADDIAIEIRQEIGGGDIYIPSPSLKVRNKAIVTEYRGDNVPQLAKKYGLSERHIMRIVSCTSCR